MVSSSHPEPPSPDEVLRLLLAPRSCLVEPAFSGPSSQDDFLSAFCRHPWRAQHLRPGCLPLVVSAGVRGEGGGRHPQLPHPVLLHLGQPGGRCHIRPLGLPHHLLPCPHHCHYRGRSSGTRRSSLLTDCLVWYQTRAVRE